MRVGADLPSRPQRARALCPRLVSFWQMARVAGHVQREGQTIELTPDIIGGAISGLEP